MRKLSLLILFIIFISGCTTQTTVPTTPQYSFEILDYPTSVRTGEDFTITWKLNTDSPTTITHTAVHYSTQSHAGEYNFDVTPANSGYTSLTTDFASGNFMIPNRFSVKIRTPDSTKLYYRVHAIIDGKNYWTIEYTADVQGTSGQGTLQGQVTQPTTIPPPLEPSSASIPTTKDFTIEADDRGFYIDSKDTSSIAVLKGQLVKISFKVKQDGTYYGGLDFRGCGQDTPDTKPGDFVQIQFTADQTCTITSYWPASNVKKDTLQVMVTVA